MKNKESIHKASTHIRKVYNLINDLNKEFGDNETLELIKIYGMVLYFISFNIMPKLGMSGEEITNLVSSLNDSKIKKI